MADNKIKSPDKLELKGKTKKGKYFGKKAGFLVFSVIGAIFLAIVFGIASRDASNKSQQSNTGSNNLIAASGESQKIYANIPDSITVSAKKTETNNMGTVPAPAPELANNIPTLPTPQNADQNSQKLKEQREQALLKALSSETNVSSWDNFKNNTPSPSSAVSSTTSALSQPREGNPAIAAINEAAKQFANDNDQSRQIRKEAFLVKTSMQPDNDYLLQTVKPPIAKYEIKATTVIPSTLITGINSDLPGDIFAQVKEDVYDTATGRYLLIPKGTRLYGMYDSQIAYAQERLLVTWTRLIYPDGSSINIGGMTGGDKGGYAGFKDQINNHYGRLIGAGLLTSLFSAGFQLSQPQNNNNNNQLTSQQIAAASVGQQMTMLGIKVTEKNLNIQPTIEIRPGYEFVVKVARDIVFPSPYTGKRL